MNVPPHYPQYPQQPPGYPQYPQQGYPYRSPHEMQLEEDQRQLNVLSILFYVYGAITALLGCFFILYIVIGGVFVATAASSGSGASGPPEVVGVIFMAIGAFVVLFTWGHALLCFIAGRSLGTHKRHTLCFVMACISCIWIPLGTLLGVFTLVVLSRPTVKSLFMANAA